MKIDGLDAAHVREHLHYNPDTGIFTWIKRPFKGAKVEVGARAGYVNPDGWRIITLKSTRYPASQVAWLYVHGVAAGCILDHENTIRDDDRLDNLRKSTLSQNGANRHRHRSNKSGFKGVHFSKGKWQAASKKDRKQHYFGRFDTPEAAFEAYVAGAKALHGEFARAA